MDIFSTLIRRLNIIIHTYIHTYKSIFVHPHSTAFK